MKALKGTILYGFDGVFRLEQYPPRSHHRGGRRDVVLSSVSPIKAGEPSRSSASKIGAT